MVDYATGKSMGWLWTNRSFRNIFLIFDIDTQDLITRSTIKKVLSVYCHSIRFTQKNY